MVLRLQQLCQLEVLLEVGPFVPPVRSLLNLSSRNVFHPSVAHSSLAGWIPW